MSVIHTQAKVVDASKALYSHPDAVRAMGQAAMLSMIESCVDMIMDMPEEYKTKEAIEATLTGVHETSLDMLDDMMHDLQAKLTDYLTNVKYSAKVKEIHYDDKGISDVVVDFRTE